MTYEQAEQAYELAEAAYQEALQALKDQVALRDWTEEGDARFYDLRCRVEVLHHQRCLFDGQRAALWTYTPSRLGGGR